MDGQMYEFDNWIALIIIVTQSVIVIRRDSPDDRGAGTSQRDIALRWPRMFSIPGWSVRDKLRHNRPRV